jgi:hypothetical protein
MLHLQLMPTYVFIVTDEQKLREEIPTFITLIACDVSSPSIFVCRDEQIGELAMICKSIFEGD